MSDVEEEPAYQNQNSDPVQSGDDEEIEEEQERPRQKSSKQRRREYEDDDEDDEDEDDEEDEEDEGTSRGKKRQKRIHRKPAVNRFLDVEAEVDDDEEEVEDDEEAEFGRDAFIADAAGEGDEDDLSGRSLHHRRLDRRERELDDQDLIRIAQDISQRNKRSTVHYTGDMNDIPQRLLMPDVKDANLWQVRCKPGRERDLVFSLMRKAIDLEFSARPLQILSAFQRDSLVGMIYVEARSQKQVAEACNGLVGIYPSRGITLVPIEEMSSLLQIKKQELTVTPGTWVRIRRGKYQGDLAQVMDITENGEEVGLKFIPRIDLNPKDDLTADGKKRKKAGVTVSTGIRPPQRFFQYEDVIKVYGRKMVAKRNQVYVFQNDTYKDGFIEKDYKLSGLILENVNPTLDEITRFAKGADGADGDSNVDLSIIAEASRKAAIAVLQPGDHVEVFEGEQSGVHGIVETIAQDVVTINPVGVNLEGQKVEVPARSVRKRFKAGDHVKVMAGKNTDETGLVVAVADNVVTFISDMSMQEVSVFSKDLREASEVGASTNTVGNYELHDLVQLDQQTIGVIYKTERDSFRVLDQNGQTRLIHPHQISMRRDSNRAIATDSEGHELRINDNVREVDGEGRKGRVLHIHQSFFAFLHNRDISENGGVFVTRARSLASLAPKGNAIQPGADLSKMNPAMTGGGMVGSGNIGRGPRDRLVGVSVTVVKGPHKGYNGLIKDTNGPVARVELNTGNKVITIDKDKLRRRNPNGKLEPLEGAGFGGMGPPRNPGSFGAGRTPNPYAQSSRTPAWGSVQGRTPNPYADSGKTPAWSSSSRTPNPYAQDGGRTPAWSSSSKTPNPYAQDSGSNAWGASSRTPNPYTTSGGSGGGWGSSPQSNNSTSSFNNVNNGGRTPGRNGSWSPAHPTSSGNYSNESWESAASAPTPAAWNAPTPWSAPTPAPSSWLAPTPAAAPTPAPASLNAKTPAASGWPGVDMVAETPAVSGEFRSSNVDEEELPQTWLKDVPEAKCSGLVVRVQGSREGSSEQLRRYENHEGKVKGKVKQGDGSSGLEVTVDINGEEVEVPIGYLLPVRPTRLRSQVVVLYGKHKGKDAQLDDKSGGMWLLKFTDSPLDELPEDRLCLWEPGDPM